MQIKLGEIIRELRKRDGRKQEDLAVALGVTNQAVSRWEANGGYPDIEMLPAIANYFHITIDELFGYGNDRQIKLQSYIDQADQMAISTVDQGKVLNCEDTERRVEFLRKAISEFPSEWQLQCRLADALVTMGYEKYKPRAIAPEGCGYIRNDTENNAQNGCWQEAISLYKAVLKQDIDDDSRTKAIRTILLLYSYMGDFENAERTALSQPPMEICRELLLASAAEDEKGDEYRGEAMLILLHELYMVMVSSVKKKPSLAHSQAGHDTLLALTRLYERIFDDGNCGWFHNDMCNLYLECSSAAVELKDSERALHYFENALDHFIKFDYFMKSDYFTKSKPAGGIFQLTAPLVCNVNLKNCFKGIVIVDREDLEDHMQAFPAECVEAIRNNPRYASIFAE